MNYLLDTHVFLWGSYDEAKLSGRVLKIIDNTNNNLFLSSGSVWEIVIKTKLGKLVVPKDLNSFIAEQINFWRIKPLPIQISHAVEINNLPAHHKDPFDRILISQANIEKLTIITNDSQIKRYSVKTVW